jgi:hypothetical protein
MDEGLAEWEMPNKIKGFITFMQTGCIWYWYAQNDY